MKYIVLLLLVFPSISIARNRKCDLTEAQWNYYLSLDFKSFDQSPPNGGWRGFANKGCEISAGHLIDQYRFHHLKKLLKWQERVLIWHAGQMYAMGNIYTLARVRFMYSYNTEQDPKNPFDWNSYVTASIGFIEKDLVKLKKARDQLAKNPEANGVNLKIIENLVKCPNLPYKIAYTPEPLKTCELP